MCGVVLYYCTPQPMGGHRVALAAPLLPAAAAGCRAACRSCCIGAAHAACGMLLGASVWVQIDVSCWGSGTQLPSCICGHSAWTESIHQWTLSIHCVDLLPLAAWPIASADGSVRLVEWVTSVIRFRLAALVGRMSQGRRLHGLHRMQDAGCPVDLCSFSSLCLLSALCRGSIGTAGAAHVDPMASRCACVIGSEGEKAAFGRHFGGVTGNVVTADGK